ncbi:hypothetical protein [Cupriavidus basilensis]|uniref:hypothetical protein n=1 Tax=Cupriavidus basilensis TaxID=68895 RepID=UPI00157B55B2|nr:hypothetical protein [Cupriavidus basilensis]NUA30176.1 hypothetical protein [Cupriavidus basilensis]
MTDFDQDKLYDVEMFALDVAALLALLRSLILSGHPLAEAAQSLFWTVENANVAEVRDEGIQVVLDEYVRSCRALAEGA